MKRASLIGMLCVVVSLSANSQTGGVEQASANANTKGKACESALESAEARANNKAKSAGSGLSKADITKKKCDCDESKDKAQAAAPWSCVGMVTWELRK